MNERGRRTLVSPVTADPGGHEVADRGTPGGAQGSVVASVREFVEGGPDSPSHSGRQFRNSLTVSRFPRSLQSLSPVARLPGAPFASLIFFGQVFFPSVGK